MKKKYTLTAVLAIALNFGIYAQQNLPFSEIFTEVIVGSGTLPVSWSSNATTPVEC